MKNIQIKSIMSFFIGLLLSFSSCSQDFKKLPDDNVGQASFEAAEKFIDDFYASLKQGTHYEFGDEATEEVKSSITPEIQKNIYQQIRDQFGEYKNAEYAETWIQSAMPEFKIMRYKGNYSDNNTKLEVRVVLNGENKIAGFFIKPWSDMLN